MILIDYNGIAISNIVAMKLDVEENLIRHMILNSIRLHRRKYKDKYGEVVIATDGMKNWRRDAFPYYKAKRKDARKQSSMDWNEVFRIINMVLEEIKENFPYKVVSVDSCEADDIIGTLVNRTQEFGNYENVMIISGDKDFVQLQQYDNVAQYSPVQKKAIKTDNPRLDKLDLILSGDTADGVPNVLSADNCLAEGIRQTPLRKKIKEQLMNDPKSMGEEVFRNIQRNDMLINLDRTPNPIKEKIIYTYEQQDPWENKGKVFPYLVEKDCRMLIDEIGDFI